MILLFIFLFSLYLFIRNFRVYNIKCLILEACAEHCRKHSDVNIREFFNKFCNKYSYFELLFSFKRLSLESLFTEEELKELLF